MNLVVTKTIFIIAQIILSVILTAIFSMLLNSEVSDLLNTSLMEQYLPALLGLGIGVALPGFFYLYRLDKSAIFLKSVLYSLLGLGLFFMVYEILDSLLLNDLPYYLNSSLIPYTASLTGAIVGFYYRIKINKRHTETE